MLIGAFSVWSHCLWDGGSAGSRPVTQWCSWDAGPTRCWSRPFRAEDPLPSWELHWRQGVCYGIYRSSDAAGQEVIAGVTHNSGPYLLRWNDAQCWSLFHTNKLRDTVIVSSLIRTVFLGATPVTDVSQREEKRGLFSSRFQ